jgi:hypothetical protein
VFYPVLVVVMMDVVVFMRREGLPAGSVMLLALG